MRQRILFLVYGHLKVSDHWKNKGGLVGNRLYFIHGGKGCYEVAGVKHSFKPNKFYLIPSTAKSKLYSDKDDPIVHTYCDFEVTPPIISPVAFEGTLDDDPMLSSALDVFVAGGKEASKKRAITQDFEHISVEKENLYRSAIEYIVFRLMENSKNYIVNDTAVTAAIEYMYDHISEKISVGDIASAVYMSEGGFIKHFKKVTSETPYAYLKKIRIDMAYYLREQGKTIEEISELVGYSDGVALLHAMKN